MILKRIAPPKAQTLLLLGDTHFGGWSEGRQKIVSDDLRRASVPQDVPIVQVGDLVSTGTDDLFTTAREYMDSLGGQWWACVGNHDLDGSGGSRTPSEAAALMEMPGENFIIDLDYCVLVFMFIRAPGSPGYAPDYTFLEDTLTSLVDRTVFLIGHPPLVDINPIGPSSRNGDLSTLYATELMEILDQHDCLKGYLCGHTHPGLNEIGTIMKVNTGSRDIAQLTVPCAYYTAPGVDWTDGLWSMWLTVYDDRFEVRARDHGAHQWVGSSLENIPVWVFPL